MDDDQMQTLFQHVLLDREFGKFVARAPVAAFASLGIELDPKNMPREGVKLPSSTAIFRAWKESVGDCRVVRAHHRVFLPCCGKERK